VQMAPEPAPPFATYLLPPFNYPFHRRESSTTYSEASAPSLYSSPTSSPGTTPSSSPPNALFTLPNWKGKGIFHESLQQEILQKIPKGQSPVDVSRLRRVQPNTLKCLTCATDIAFASQVVSKGFTGRHGRAYLVSVAPSVPYNWKTKTKPQTDLINIKVGRSVNRELLTGAHVVADVSCVICGTILGWKYVDAKEMAQRYKIGKFILEMKRVGLGVSWEDATPGHENPDATTLGINPQVSDGWTRHGGADAEGDVVFDSEDEDECEDLFAGTWDAETVSRQRRRKVVVRRKNTDADVEAV
jgi:hypothetical protein